MESADEIIHKTAKDWARENNHPEIVELLSKRPSQAYKSLVERKKKLHRVNINQKRKIRNLEKESTSNAYLAAISRYINDILSKKWETSMEAWINFINANIEKILKVIK